MNEDEYQCKKCKEIWGFIPDDYHDKDEYPIICPLCYMPLSQMIKDVYKQEGILEVFKQFYKRYF
jgi:protein-disulfide isomerase